MTGGFGFHWRNVSGYRFLFYFFPLLKPNFWFFFFLLVSLHHSQHPWISLGGKGLWLGRSGIYPSRGFLFPVGFFFGAFFSYLSIVPGFFVFLWIRGCTIGFFIFTFFQHRHHHHSRVFFNNGFFHHDGNSQKNIITNLIIKYSAVRFAGRTREREFVERDVDWTGGFPLEIVSSCARF